MCFFTQQTKDATAVKNRYNAEFENVAEFQTSDYINGFTYPKMSIIANSNDKLIRNFSWGLIPHWSKDDTIKKHTLNARIETLTEKPAFRDSAENRCLVIADGFYEWKWLDSKGKNKQKYLITLPDNNLFSFAGIWSNWANTKTGEIVHSFSIVTTGANELMAEIHNTKKRMPVILTPENEKVWLSGDKIQIFQKYDLELKAKPLNATYPLF